MMKHCALMMAAGAFLVFLTGIAGTSSAVAQTALQSETDRRGPTSPQERDKLYKQLRRQAEVLEKQAAIVKTVAKLIGPTVVHIEADVTDRESPQFGRRSRVEEAGSGVVVQINGKFYIFTNRHVIKGARSEGIRIKLADGRQIHPAKVWEDPETDIAVMAITAPGLVASPLGDSDRMQIGDFVLAVGSPFGLSHSVTYGIISAKGRRDLELGGAGVRFQDFIQTDAAINPGNSGGPLINLRGEIIGINTAIASNSGGNEGIGFAIPIKMFAIIARQLIEQGKVSRAFLGVTLDSKFGPAMAAEIGLLRPMGARITGITPNSPAAEGKLQIDDVVLRLEGVPVEDDAHLVNLVSMTKVGKVVALEIFREHKQISVKLAVGNRSNFTLPE